jgi:hypothetical protein
MDTRGLMRREPVSAADQFGLANLVIVGVPKAGTSSLFTYLSRHPDVCPADVMETRYLNPLRHGEELAALDSWRAHWTRRGDERYFLEATPGYFYGGDTLAQGLKKLSPSCKVVLSLRSPDARCWSYYRFVSSRGRIPKTMTFREYIDRCQDEPMSGQESSAYRGLHGGEYSKYLPAWIDTFGENLHILWFDEMVTNPDKVFAALLDWLDLPRIDTDPEPEAAMTGYRSESLQRAAAAVNRAGRSFFPKHPTLTWKLRHAYHRVNSRTMALAIPDPERAWLRSYYAPFNAVLAEQIEALGLYLPDSFEVEHL